jgi:hypothetical protein
MDGIGHLLEQRLWGDILAQLGPKREQVAQRQTARQVGRRCFGLGAQVVYSTLRCIRQHRSSIHRSGFKDQEPGTKNRGLP